jgi:hypothetical protein
MSGLISLSWQLPGMLAQDFELFHQIEIPR